MNVITIVDAPTATPMKRKTLVFSLETFARLAELQMVMNTFCQKHRMRSFETSETLEMISFLERAIACNCKTLPRLNISLDFFLTNLLQLWVTDQHFRCLWESKMLQLFTPLGRASELGTDAFYLRFSGQYLRQMIWGRRVCYREVYPICVVSARCVTRHSFAGSLDALRLQNLAQCIRFTLQIVARVNSPPE